MEIKQILAERKGTHGDFTHNAKYAQDLKAIVEDTINWNVLTPVQKEALHMILHKVSRICAGDPNHIDSWEDIAGYAKLAADRIEVDPVIFRTSDESISSSPFSAATMPHIGG